MAGVTCRRYLVLSPLSLQCSDQLAACHQQAAERQRDPEHDPDHVVDATRQHAAERRRRNHVDTLTAGKTVAFDRTVLEEQRQREQAGEDEHCGVEEQRAVQADHGEPRLSTAQLITDHTQRPRLSSGSWRSERGWDD